MSVPVLTIDGPSGAGKGTVSRAVAMELGWGYLDSGCIYRALAVAINQQHLANDNTAAIVRVAQTMTLDFTCTDKLTVTLNGADITQQLATQATSNTASVIATHPQVRATLLQKQQDFRRPPGLVADGRDMGTVVFADATKKVYLTASSKQRATRRHQQLLEQGINANLVQISKEMVARDLRDSQRLTAPLQVLPDALYIDSSALSIAQVVAKILAWVR